MESEPLLVEGFRVDRSLLEIRRGRPCRFGECEAMCCSEGVYLFDHEVDDLLANQDQIKPHLPDDRRDAAGWFDGVEIPDTDHPDGGSVQGTMVVNDSSHPAGETCVFLRPDRACALQVAGIEAGQHPWRFKPLYCCLHPLVFDGGVLTVADESSVSRAGGDCIRPDPSSDQPMYRVYEAEARLALGDDAFEALDSLVREGNAG